MTMWSKTARRVAIWASGAFVAATAAVAQSQSCPEGRSPLEIEGHILCLPVSKPPPFIVKDENGKVTSLSWGLIDQLPAASPAPRGSSYLHVEKGLFFPPTIEQTEPYDLPNMRKIIYGRLTTLYPQGVTLNGQPFQLRCNELSVNPARAMQGGQDCQIDAFLATGIRIHVLERVALNLIQIECNPRQARR
jgi:hypothetical protein